MIYSVQYVVIKHKKLLSTFCVANEARGELVTATVVKTIFFVYVHLVKLLINLAIH